MAIKKQKLVPVSVFFGSPQKNPPILVGDTLDPPISEKKVTFHTVTKSDLDDYFYLVGG